MGGLKSTKKISVPKRGQKLKVGDKVIDLVGKPGVVTRVEPFDAAKSYPPYMLAYLKEHDSLILYQTQTVWVKSKGSTSEGFGSLYKKVK